MFKFIDLFAGIGGFRIPLEEIGGNCVFSSEIDKHSILTYEANFKELPHGDIKDISEKDIPEHDLLAAGFPCQPFSIAGKMRGFDDTRGTLFFEIARIVKYHKPKVILLENVKNLVSHDNGNTISVIKNTLEALNYDVYMDTLNAKYFGLPQNRQRVYLVCFNRDYNVKRFNFPKKSNEIKVVRDILEDEPDGLEKLLIRRNDIYPDLENIKLDEIKERHTKPLRLATINKGGQGDRVYSSKGVGITLSAYGGGSGSKTGAYYINNKIRKLSVREAARMQGFPESFEIPVSDSQAWTQFGNAVPINVVREIIKEIIRTNIFS